MPNYLRNPVAILPFVAFILLFWLVYSAPKDGEGFPICGKHCEVTVGQVIDGDTFDAEGVRYRLANQNAEEAGTVAGDIATDCLRRRIEGQRIKIDTFGHDVYGRVLARVTSHYTTC